MNNATLNIEQYTMKDLYDVFDMSTTDAYTRAVSYTHLPLPTKA